MVNDGKTKERRLIRAVPQRDEHAEACINTLLMCLLRSDDLPDGR